MGYGATVSGLSGLGVGGASDSGGRKKKFGLPAECEPSEMILFGPPGTLVAAVGALGL